MPLWFQSLHAGLRLARRAKALVLVPLIMDLVVLLVLLATGALPRAPAAPEFTLPVALPSLFQVVGAEAQALPFGPFYELPPLPGQQEASLALLLLVLVLQSLLAAGYLHSLDAVRRGNGLRSFPGGTSHAFSRLLAYHAVTGFLLLVADPHLRDPVASGPGSLFVLGAVVLLLYAVFLTPFAVVVDNLPFSLALRRSVILVFREARQTVPYAVAYGVLTALVSGAFLLLRPLGPWALLGAAGLYAVAGTVLVGSTLHLYASLRPTDPLAAPAPEPVPAEEAAPW